MRALRLVLALVALLAAAPVAAQAPPAPAPSVSADELEKLVGLLENEAERQRFVEQLRALIAAERKLAPEEPAIPDRVAARFLGRLSEQLAEFGQAVFRAAAFVADAPKLGGWLRQQVESEWSRALLTEIAWKLLVVLFGAWLAEWIATRLLGGARRRLEARHIHSGWARLPLLLLYALVELAPVVVFALAAFGILALVEPSRTAGFVALALINANLIARAIRVVAWILLSPRVIGLRLAPLDDETAHYLYIWARRLTNVVVYGYFGAEAALLIGLPRAGHLFLLKLLGLVVALLLIILILQNRAAVARAIAGRVSPDPNVAALRRRLADVWHVGALLYVLLVAFIWLVRPEGGFAFVARATAATLGLTLAAWLLARLLRALLARLFRLSHELRALFPTLELRANRYVQVIALAGTAVIYLFAALAILQAWGAGSLEWLTTETGRRVSGSVISIGVTILVALGLWELITAVLERYFNRPAANGLDSLRRAARARTLLPLMQQISFGVLAVFVGLIALSEIGVNIAPLLAGAGVVGIAVGFGAQAVMKDLFSGISIVMEDSIAVGDIVAIGDKGGVVEWMSLRVMRLRDFDGTVHTIPFGEVQTISNRTKDFAYAVFRIGVAYDADIDKVQRVVREIAAAMRKAPEFAPMILDEVELHGVDAFGDSAIIVLARIKVMPGKQWTVTRAFNTRLKVAFEREGIEIPYPHRVVRVVAEPAGAEAKLAGPARDAALS